MVRDTFGLCKWIRLQHPEGETSTHPRFSVSALRTSFRKRARLPWSASHTPASVLPDWDNDHGCVSSEFNSQSQVFDSTHHYMLRFGHMHFISQGLQSQLGGLRSPPSSSCAGPGRCCAGRRAGPGRKASCQELPPGNSTLNRMELAGRKKFRRRPLRF